ncbi:hypothetical protein GUJ93_ZPchr0006g42458 [Zizania palustris]|uniref:Uncharacterized protein n=1 Tax=Zizania palustris TaxID=103762 RepID=A0A8J5SD04_ZIZPA|nr:hypothetical protein GUJ93_ZPchr0006g42458 [Zizania palustris]
MSRDSGGAGVEVESLWAMAAELERQFAGYKQRLAERSGAPDVVVDDDDDARMDGEEEDDGGGGCGDVRGRMYEAYARRRDERLREGWRARMERKEAEVKALWAQLERGITGAGAAGRGVTTTDAGTAGERTRDDGEKRRSSDVVAPVSSISGKKHARTRSFSSFTAKSSRPDGGTRRALLQEPPTSTSEPPVDTSDGGAGRKDRRRGARPTGAGGATTVPKLKVFSGSGHRSSAKEHGSIKGGPKLPRSLQPRRSSSGGLDDLKETAVLPTTCAAVAAPARSCLIEQVAVHDETQNASSSTAAPFPGAANARAASPYSDSGEIVEGVTDGRGDEARNVEEHDAEEAAVSPGKLLNGEITSDSDTEPSYVYIKKDVEEFDHFDAMKTLRARRSDQALAGSDARPELEVEKKSSEDGEETMAPSVAVAAESATTTADEAPARENSDDLSFSGRSGAGSPPSSPPASCISRAPSIERLLEEDAALLRKKREESAERRAMTTLSTPPPTRVSGGARSPREATVRGFKRFLSFGKKNRGREVTVIDCTSPSVPSLADDDSGSGRWHSTDTIKPRMASSDASSDDMDHGYAIAISARACSLQSLVAASPAKSELNEIEPQEKSPKGEKHSCCQ